MTAILAIETATDACSVALYRDGEYRQCHELRPREHARRLFPLLNEILENGKLGEQGITALAYGCGPGSFTGLRIAASAVQGLAYAGDLPAIPVSTLACQAATALRLGRVSGSRPVLSTIDARINEIYWAVYTLDEGLPHLLHGPFATNAEGVQIDAALGEIDILGSGCTQSESFSGELRSRFAVMLPDALPEARDLVPMALASHSRGELQVAEQVQPLYVRDEISWKKLSEQGKQA